MVSTLSVLQSGFGECLTLSVEEDSGLNNLLELSGLADPAPSDGRRLEGVWLGIVVILANAEDRDLLELVFVDLDVGGEARPIDVAETAYLELL